MDDDEEKFYDSLDEEQNSLHKNKPKRSDKIVQVTSLVMTPRNNNKTHTKIPLYVGEINKEDLQLKKKTDTPSKNCTNKMLTTCFSCSHQKNPKGSKSKLSLCLGNEEKSPNTYWNIFCKQNGIPQFPTGCDKRSNSITDSTRPTCDTYTSRTLNSFSTCSSYTLERSPVWDTPSLYEGYMSGTRDCNLNSSFNNLSATEEENLKSISQVNLSNTKEMRRNIRKKSVIKLNTTDDESNSSITKIERLRKQLEYGKRVSNRNRAKILIKQNIIKPSTN